jgi:quercetin dioxygenase-like cupin family protein
VDCETFVGKASDILENPITGERMVFRKRSKDTNGELMQSDFFMRPHSKGVATVEHIQPDLVQRLEVISGVMSYTLGKSKEKKIAKPGEKVLIPPKVPHSIWNDGDEELHALDEYEPAYNIEKFFETAYGLAKDGVKCNKKTGVPNISQLCVMLQGFNREIGAAPGAPKIIAALAAIIAPIARSRGYRAWYAKYSGEDSER